MALTIKQTLVLVSTMLALLSSSALAQQERNLALKSAHAGNMLNELRDKHRALLVVFRSHVLDVSNGERAIMEDVLKADPKPKGRNQWVYNQLAQKLNSY